MGEVENSIFNPLCEKIRAINLHLQFLRCANSDKRSIQIINKIKGTIHNISTNINALEAVLHENNKLYHEMKFVDVHISHLLDKVDEMQQSCLNINYQEHDAKNNNMLGQIEPSSTTSCSSIIEFSPMDTSIPKPIFRCNLKPQYLSFGVSHIKDEDFKTLSKYMVGRLTLNMVNDFIDVVNDTFTKKYSILSKSKQSLKAEEFKLYNKYQKQQASELKGKHFVTEEDIARECNRTTLDKRSSNYLTILRHTKRLLRHSINGLVVYIITNVD